MIKNNLEEISELTAIKENMPEKESYIKTTNESSGIDLIWKTGSDTVLAQIDSGSYIFSNNSNKVIINYNLNQKLNDSLYTYFDTILKVKRYKKNITMISVPMDDTGAL